MWENNLVLLGLISTHGTTGAPLHAGKPGGHQHIKEGQSPGGTLDVQDIVFQDAWKGRK